MVLPPGHVRKVNRNHVTLCSGVTAQDVLVVNPIGILLTMPPLRRTPALVHQLPDNVAAGEDAPDPGHAGEPPKPPDDGDEAFEWHYEGQETAGFPLDGYAHLWRRLTPGHQPAFDPKHAIIRILDEEQDTSRRRSLA